MHHLHGPATDVQRMMRVQSALDVVQFTAAFDPPRHANSKVLSVLVVLQPPYRIDRPGDMVVLEAKF